MAKGVNVQTGFIQLPNAANIQMYIAFMMEGQMGLKMNVSYPCFVNILKDISWAKLVVPATPILQVYKNVYHFA